MLGVHVALGVLVGGLAAGGILRSALLPRRWHFPFNIGMGLFAVGVARLGGLGASELGLETSTVGHGTKLGLKASGVIVAALGVAGVAGLLDSEDTHVDAPEMASRVLLIIPVGTVLVEELAFRGALQGLLERVTSSGRSLVIGSVLFGLWHVPPLWSDEPGLVLGTVVATTAAGAGFMWLRRRSGSVVAPVLVHIATNSGAFAASWMLGR